MRPKKAIKSNKKRTLLSIKEIRELIPLIRKIFNYNLKLREEYSLAKMIKFPSIPPTFSESLAIHLLTKKTILKELSGYKIDFGGREADIIAFKKGDRIKIEVKATGKSAFQYFGEKDIKADYLIWLHFGDLFLKDDKDKIRIYLIKDPQKYFPKTLKITIRKLEKEVGNELYDCEFDLGNL